MTENLEQKSKGIDGFGCFLGVLAIVTAGLLCYVIPKTINTGREIEIQKIKSSSEVQTQRLKTIEELTKAYGNKMTPQEFRAYVNSMTDYKNQGGK